MSLGSTPSGPIDPLAELEGLGGPTPPMPASQNFGTAPPKKDDDPFADIMGTPPQQPQSSGNPLDDLMGGFSTAPVPSKNERCNVPERSCHPSTQAGMQQGRTGVNIQAAFQRTLDERIVLKLTIDNQTGEPLREMAIKFRPNPFGLNPT